jgi:gamma-glutamylcyclotransferase (GGCT)/AIG2-like uncharacterized protein YtfP
MARTLRLFVYGTLQPQLGTPMGAWIAARLVRCAEPASVSGHLHAIRAGAGWFPALVPGCGPRRVAGTLCELRLEPGALAVLGRYEGREYRRVAMPVRTASGRRVRAQVYVWRTALPAEARHVAGGDFRAWLRIRRLGAFS